MFGSHTSILRQKGLSTHKRSADLPQERPLEPFHSRIRVPALDGLRGIAVSAVVVYHSVLLYGFYPTRLVGRVFYKLILTGWSGVDLFFVLSGFLITGILYDSKGRDGYFRNFYLRRILRIFPLYYGFLCLFFFVIPLLVPVGRPFSSVAKDQIWYWTYLANVPAIKGWPPYVSHFWSLSVEEQFYLVWPWVVGALSRRKLMLACLGMVAGAFGVRVALVAMGQDHAAFVLTPARMDALAVGGLLALIAREPGGLSRLARWAGPAVVSSAVLLGMIFLWRQSINWLDPVVGTIGFTLLAILFGGILATAVTSPPGTVAGRLFAHRFLRFLGRYSYGIYVFHFPIIGYVAGFLNVKNVPSFLGSRLPGQLAFTAVTASISLAVALLSWHLLEAQFLKLKACLQYDAMAGHGSGDSQDGSLQESTLYDAKREPLQSNPQAPRQTSPFKE